MEIHVHVHEYSDKVIFELLTNLSSRIRKIEIQGENIMATQDELVAKLNDVAAELTKVGAETTKLLQMIADLQGAAANASPELVAAVDAVAAQAKVVDDLVPDATA